MSELSNIEKYDRAEASVQKPNCDIEYKNRRKGIMCHFIDLIFPGPDTVEKWKRKYIKQKILWSIWTSEIPFLGKVSYC